MFPLVEPPAQIFIEAFCAIDIGDPATGGAANFGQSALEKDRQNDHNF
jgi:hypothetical protein